SLISALLRLASCRLRPARLERPRLARSPSASPLSQAWCAAITRSRLRSLAERLVAAASFSALRLTSLVPAGRRGARSRTRSLRRASSSLLALSSPRSTGSRGATWNSYAHVAMPWLSPHEIKMRSSYRFLFCRKARPDHRGAQPHAREPGRQLRHVLQQLV